MVNRANLPNRVEKAKGAVPFIKVLSRDLMGRPKTLLVPGSDAKLYHVIVRRHAGVSTEINIDTGGGLIKPDYAHKNVTYHSMAALMYCARERGFRIRWCADKVDAKNLSNLGGAPFTVTNHDNASSKLYGVYVE